MQQSKSQSQCICSSALSMSKRNTHMTYDPTHPILSRPSDKLALRAYVSLLRTDDRTGRNDAHGDEACKGLADKNGKQEDA